MSFEYYYITVVGLVMFIVAIVIALVMNERYFRLIKNYLSQTKEAEAHGGGQALSGEVEVLMCPRCGFTKQSPSGLVIMLVRSRMRHALTMVRDWLFTQYIIQGLLAKACEGKLYIALTAINPVTHFNGK